MLDHHDTVFFRHACISPFYTEKNVPFLMSCLRSLQNCQSIICSPGVEIVVFSLFFVVKLYQVPCLEGTQSRSLTSTVQVALLSFLFSRSKCLLNLSIESECRRDFYGNDKIPSKVSNAGKNTCQETRERERGNEEIEFPVFSGRGDLIKKGSPAENGCMQALHPVFTPQSQDGRVGGRS